MADPSPTQSSYTRSGDGNQVKSAGTLMKEVTEDLSTLVRKEMELAKQELGRSISEKVKGGAIIAVAGVFALFALIFLLVALRDGINELFWRAEAPWAWAADLITAAILLVIGAVAGLVAKKKLATPISTEMTKKTIKEDVEWAKTLGRQ